MSYRIEYGPAIPPKYQKKTTTQRLQTMTALWLLLFAFLVRQFFPAGTLKLRQVFLLPTPTVTETALTDMMSQIQSGSSLGDAFTAFCQQIIAHDQYLLH